VADRCIQVCQPAQGLVTVLVDRGGPFNPDITTSGSARPAGTGSDASVAGTTAVCSGRLKIIASIEEPQVIAKILSHLQRTAPEQYKSELAPGARAPPVQSRLL